MASGAGLGYLAHRQSRQDASVGFDGESRITPRGFFCRPRDGPTAARARTATQTAPHLRGAVWTTRHAWLTSVHLHCRGRRMMVSAWSVSSAHAATIRLPRHASRGWSRVGTWLPCTDRWSVIPFYWAVAALKRPQRDRFVISIDHVRSMQPEGWPRRSAGSSARARLALAAFRRARSGSTACGWPTSSSSGRSATESLQAKRPASR